MNLYAIVLGIIVVTLLGVSLARLGKVKTKADYLVAGRSLPRVRAGLHAAFELDRLRLAAGRRGERLQAWLRRAVAGRRRMGRAAR